MFLLAVAWAGVAVAGLPAPGSLPSGDAAVFDKYRTAAPPAPFQPAPEPIETAARLPTPMAGRSIRLSSPFGIRRDPLLGTPAMHRGIDLASRRGAPVYASADGIVVYAGWRGGYGELVAIDHGGGMQTRYGHLDRILVPAGRDVHRGEMIGLVGSTGRSTGPHLHFEVRVAGTSVDPLPMITEARPPALAMITGRSRRGPAAP